MEINLSNKKLSRFMLTKVPARANFLDKLKIAYRPYICPFGELLEMLPAQAAVFDIGCGSGMFLSLVAEFKDPRLLGGIEISQSLIDNAFSLLDNTNQNESPFLHVFDGLILPHEIYRFDYIFLIDVLHHVPPKNQWKFLQNIYAGMQPGAKLILKDINAENFILSKFNKLHDFIFAGQAGHELAMTEVKNALEKLGFKIISTQQKRIFFYPHYTLVCKK
ncbi:MAG: class I SAM-dependent methyltransferase [Candidatus Shapirobacteria bacterium]|nr:class I SAM-dependent methyltransferase [Candidatus Shapirobacteria bacterium]